MPDRSCSVPGCGKPHYARGYCNPHYQRWKKHGDPLGAYQPNSSRTCAVVDCERPVKHRDWCGKHYQRWRNHGDPLANHSRVHVDTPCVVDDCLKLAIAKGFCAGHYTRSRSGKTRSDKPLRRYVVTDDLTVRLREYAPPGAPSECWPWTGATNKGYGVIAVAGSKSRIAHDVAWEVHHGRPLPDGMLIRHSCDNPPCCNPAHLLLGTHGDNSQDKVERDRQAKGSGHGIAKLTEVDIPIIRSLYAGGATQRVIGERFGISQTAVSLIIRGRTWNHIVS